MFFIVAYLILLPEILMGKNLTHFDGIIAPRPAPQALLVDREKMLVLGRRDRELVSFSAKWFDEKPKKQDFPNDLEKFELADVKESPAFAALLLFENKLAVLDGRKMMLRIFDRASKKVIGEANLPWDTAKPAKDRIGEPPAHEVNAFRKQLKRLFRANDLKALSATFIKPIGTTARIVILTPFNPPLLEVQCNENDPFSCYIARGCSAPNFPGKKDRTTLASDGNEIYVAGRSGRVMVYNFESCVNVRKFSEIKLPNAIKPISAMHRTKEFLYVATESPVPGNDEGVFRIKWE